MGKTLMMAKPGSTLTSGDECNLFGYISDSATEANTQASATEAGTFSGLGININSGGSGTNTLRFRDAGANGAQIAEIAGAGIAEDTTNNDILSAGDLFNLAYTDTGTDPVVSWIKGNVELSSGHGCFQGSASFNGIVCDVASATRFLSLVGGLSADGVAVENDAAWRVRGYDTFEALQVRISANARNNDSIFRNRINAGNGTGVITFASGITGLLTATGLADAIADAQTIDVSIELGTGAQDLTVSFVLATLKSVTSMQDVLTGSQAGVSRTGSGTAVYVPIGGHLSFTAGFTEAQARVKPGFAGQAKNLRCYLSANTYAGDGTLKLYQNGSPVITLTLAAGGGAGWYENTADVVAFDNDDEFSFEFDEGTSGSITVRAAGVTFIPPDVLMAQACM